MAITGIANAFREEIPLIYITGVSSVQTDDDFQRLDLSILNNIVKHTERIDET